MAKAAPKTLWRPDTPKVRRVIAALEKQHPGAWTELAFKDAYQLLIATVLSAQSSDARVNGVTPALFERYPDARALAKATTDELEPQIKPTGFFRAKSRALAALAAAIVERHGGAVPGTMDALTALPGVGRKTANVVLNVAFGESTMAVDTHIFRIGNRTGLAPGRTPREVEDGLVRRCPPELLRDAHHWLILHGRYVCKARAPECWRCVAAPFCNYRDKVLVPAPGG